MNYLKSILLFFMCQSAVAQVPNNAEDISPLLISETIPNATLLNPKGKKIQLDAILKTKPTVLIFYRGGWCPFCNLQLSGLVKIEKEITDLGFQMIAISPDDYRNLDTTIEKNEVSYQVFSDPDAKLIQKIGIGFETPLMIKGYVATKKHIGKTSEVMPVPSVFVVDVKGKILFEYINPNYKERINEDLLLAALKTLK